MPKTTNGTQQTLDGKSEQPPTSLPAPSDNEYQIRALLSRDELTLLYDYREMVRREKFGELFVAFERGRVVNYWTKTHRNPRDFRPKKKEESP